MNYRHIYHAGNFGDVLKHIVLARMIAYMKRKDGAFRVIDTHAGIGQYDLSSEEAQKTGEWLGGIGKLLDAVEAGDIPDEVSALIAPYMEIVRGGMVEDELGAELAVYPGSPQIARALIREQDRLGLTELHPVDFETLKDLYFGDIQVRTNLLDGWLALGAHVPPKEKRGIVLVDPCFEKRGELELMAKKLGAALKRWKGGTYCLWYPIKVQAEVDDYSALISQICEKSGVKEAMRVELCVREPIADNGMAGTGLTLINPPYTLKSELELLMPFLTRIFSEGPEASFKIESL